MSGMRLKVFGSPATNGKEPKHDGHYGHKGRKGGLIDGHFSFVPFVSFVFKMGSSLKTVKPGFLCALSGFGVSIALWVVVFFTRLCIMNAGEAVSRRMGEPNMEISAATLIWEFFLAHPMP
jgi:hypothetical protein